MLASAIAAATFSGAALAQESNLPTIYGNIQLAVTHDNVDGGGSEVEHFDNGSTIGVLHDHQVAPGVEGFFKAEFHFNADDNNDAGSGIYEIDEAYVGVRGDNFGQIW
ncbi:MULTISPECIES: porin [unclassified Marinobacter]|uniref:porin n=1 Tax=unclassified Marinobacter TaxID=83889 RepID=UPI002B1BD568|nr:porin [Marinobacter sp. bablab_jr008]